MNSKSPTRTRKRKKPRGGGCLGNLFFLLIGLAAGGAGLYLYQNGFEQALQNWKALWVKEPEPVVRNPSTGGRVVEATPMDLRPLHEQDPRWEAAIQSGEEGLLLYALATKEHFGDHGDPFLFRSRMADATEMLTLALEGLRSLREDLSHNKIAAMEIDKMIRHYSGSLDTMAPKAHRR